MLALSSSARQMPEKLTTAPMSVRPLVRHAISRAMSKSSSWIRIVTGPVMRLAAGHRRKERDLAGARDRGVRLHVGMVDRGADHLRLLEGVGVGFAPAGQPGDQLLYSAHGRRRLYHLLGLADALAHPGEVFHLHPSSSLMR